MTAVLLLALLAAVTHSAPSSVDDREADELALSNANAADEAAKDAADMLRDGTSSLKAEDRIGPGIKGQCVKYEGTRYYEFCIKGKNAADMLRGPHRAWHQGAMC